MINFRDLPPLDLFPCRSHDGILMSRSTPFFALLWVSLSLLPGCLPTGHWLEGEWEFDEATTRTANNEIQEGDSSPVSGKLKRLLGGAVEEFMTGSLEGATIEFTGTEMRTFQGDTGKAVSYKIIEKPNPNTVVIQKEGGQIITYHRDGRHIWFKPTDELDLRIYLKPAS